MTQWYQPRQLKDGPNAGKWHYTCSNTSGTSVYAVGACADGCPGHETADGATRHYAEGLAAGEILERDDSAEQRKCVVCSQWTQHRAMLWGEHFVKEVPICASHDIRAQLRTEVLKKYELGDAS